MRRSVSVEQLAEEAISRWRNLVQFLYQHYERIVGEAPFALEVYRLPDPYQ